jgi:hypothetical protein
MDSHFPVERLTFIQRRDDRFPKEGTMSWVGFDEVEKGTMLPETRRFRGI